MKKQKLLVATHNKGKLELFKRYLSDSNVEIISLSDLGITFDVEETGNTYEENASLKAKTYAQMSGLLTLADDGGIEIDALNGAPGIYSARYAGPNKVDSQKVDFLLEKLKNVPEDKRQAQFVSVLALAEPNEQIKLYRGTMTGKIALEPHGTPRKGLPYRQIFIPNGFEKTLSLMIKKFLISHIEKRQLKNSLNC